METIEIVRDPELDLTGHGHGTMDRLREWSSGCGRFLAWERDHLLLREPTPQEREEHKVALT